MPTSRQTRLCLAVILLLLLWAAPAAAAADLTELIRQVEPAVGLVRTYGHDGEPLGLGSGFFISPDGEFVTNRHVVAGAHIAVVETANGARYKVVSVLAAHSRVDLVKLQVETRQEQVPYLALLPGLPAKGERIAAFGNPQGLKFTVADGIVSALRQDKFADTYIQYTAPTSPGNSGGPLVNMDGAVIGIVTFGVVDGQNLNFALPAYRLGELVAYNPPAAQDGQSPLLPPMGNAGTAAGGSKGKPVVVIDVWTNLDRGREDAEKAVFSLVDRGKYQIAAVSQVMANEKSAFGEAGPLVARDKADLVAFGQKYGYDYILAAHFHQDVTYVYHKITPYYIDRLKVRIRLVEVRQSRIIYADSFTLTDYDKFYLREDLVKRVVDQAIFRIENIQALN
jgi:hypothetical protein